MPNVGKSTLFNALSSAKAVSANYPFCTIEPNVGIVNVPDKRLDVLSDLVHPQKIIPTTMEFVDIAGLVQGASKGEGLGNQFLANIREVDSIIHVVRCFEDDQVLHVGGKVSPVLDKEIIDTELQLKDLESVEKKIAKTHKLIKVGNKEAKKTLALLEKFKAHLEQGKNVRSTTATQYQWEGLKDFSLLTAKPVIYVANVDEYAMIAGNEQVNSLKKCIAGEQAELIIVSAAVEAQIADFEDSQERQLFLQEYGLEESGLNRLIKAAYKLLSLITYFTAGEKEVRAWTIQTGWKAPQAAGLIHTDFERGFIKAEVIKLLDYQRYKSEAACREAGKLHIEGKEYVVADGDIMHFRFNV